MKSIIEEEISTQASEDGDESTDQGELLFTKLLSKHPNFFQTKQKLKEDQPPPTRAQEQRKNTKTSQTSSCSNGSFLSESGATKLKIRAVRMVRKATSPKLLVTHNNKRSILLLDEGSEINCLDGDYAVENDVRLEPSANSAKAAGNTDLCILGQTVDDVYVDTKFQSTRVSINLGKATVIRNLGATMILGEPGKASNSITTDPKNRIIFADREGKLLAKPYLDQSGKASTICRISVSKLTIFHEDSLTLEVPDHLQHSEVVVTPRREYSHLFKPRIGHVGTTVKLESCSLFPINLKRHDQVADIRPTITMDALPENDKRADSVRKIIPHSEDRFKFDPTVKESVPPDIESITIDPDNQLSPEVKERFNIVNKRYADLFTTTPGRYSGFYGDVDTSLHFTQTPVQNRKVSQPNYSNDQNVLLGEKMDELIRAGILMTPEEVGVTTEYISPSQLVPKPEPNSYRLVTDFTSLNRFLKRLPSTSPTISEAKTALAGKKYFAEIDLSNYFFQGGLRRQDCAFLAVQHPFKGVYLYTASPQGLKNSSEVSYDRLGRVYGQMVQEGRLARMADGIFPLGNSEEELLSNY